MGGGGGGGGGYGLFMICNFETSFKYFGIIAFFLLDYTRPAKKSFNIQDNINSYSVNANY